MNLRWILILLVLGSGVLATGCGSPPPQFRRYVTFIRATEKQAGDDFRFKSEQLQDLDEILTAMFGTPNDPLIPAVGDVEIGKVLNINRLKMAAGAVGSDEHNRARGLYREHCAHCHGVTGDGLGPTAAFLNPYPRDYRKGQFKFKSTPVGYKPTHEDMRRIIIDGIPGTAMPSFLLLPENEIEALAEYVKYLAIRGETERNLLNLWAAGEYGKDDRLMPDASKPSADQISMLKDQAGQVVTKWLEAEASAVGISSRPTYTPEELAQSREAGRVLFQGTKANCFSCHGISALGDGQLTGFDEWTKELIAPTGVRNNELVREYMKLGMLEPRNIRPRNLRQGVFRGGRRPIDIFWRVRNGIEGTPMPGFKPEILNDGDIWNIVNYVQSLPYEPISDPRKALLDPVNVQTSPK
jgi:mono/diheme cytochrome c family protein